MEHWKKIRSSFDEMGMTSREVIANLATFSDIEDELIKVNEEANGRGMEIVQKYNEKRRPVYIKRNQIIKTIPDFWWTTFSGHPALGNLMTEEDQKIFKYVESLDVEDFKDVKSGFFITLNFKPNPYFENEKLTKTFNFCNDGTMKITCTDIKWKEGMGSPNGASLGKAGNNRPAQDQSFFGWFTKIQQNNSEGVIRDEVAEIIKEDVWVNPLPYFGHVAADEEVYNIVV